MQVTSYTDLKANEILRVLDEESKDPRTDVDMFAGEIIEINKNLEIRKAGHRHPASGSFNPLAGGKIGLFSLAD